ncbi:hypothetical protein [Aquabacterium humicola]|uniref:hypothetical protein n=1 Tax=Aquabacterium humicola TaxID=3237377 RepID=UPI0025430F21|nr:hypothetical protein [Rubrivivax pictus]
MQILKALIFSGLALVWVCMVVFMVTMLVLTVRWNKRQKQPETRLPFKWHYPLTWPAVIVQDSTWSLPRDRKTAKVARVTGLVSILAFAALSTWAIRTGHWS